VLIEPARHHELARRIDLGEFATTSFGVAVGRTSSKTTLITNTDTCFALSRFIVPTGANPGRRPPLSSSPFRSSCACGQKQEELRPWRCRRHWQGSSES